MKTTAIAVMALLGAAVLVQLCCTKPATGQPKIEQTKVESTKAERIATIDAILHAGPTGRPGDADERAALRAERVQLTGSAPSRPMATTRAAAAEPQQATQAPQIVVAQDSQATSDKEWESTKAAMDARSRRAQDLNGRQWRPGLRGKGGRYISQREFEQSVNQEIDRFAQPQN